MSAGIFTIDDRIINVNVNLQQLVMKCYNEEKKRPMGRKITKDMWLKAEQGIMSPEDPISFPLVEGADLQLGLKEGRKMRREVNKAQKHCKICRGTKVRVVDYGRADGKNILECANLNCLSTIGLTELPEGTLTEESPDSEDNFGWYLMHPVQLYYPSESKRREIAERMKQAESEPREEENSAVLYEEDVVMIRCPGQEQLVRLI